ncbi:peptidoglycan-associated lipoprotein Pal [Methylotuvimicrobium buryatense]|uniref:Peptidoglycan-associated lipoprotein n=1 Tax=Methylotuvimicrobium buryatense TaxID=95641 RepID=A0A4P9UQG6_METBY|nr:peptidoglycan-associated lipoprotein Pal [Methylotuvimicrobium buryatense]QCW83679.1 peptidoglycan-associated lipoprotein Pal [Methylotuvimicrobium buryatense]
MKLNQSVLALAIMAALLTGCSSDDETATDFMDGTQGGTADASLSGYGDGSGISGSETYGSGSGSGYGSGSAEYPNAFLGSEFSDPSNPLSKSTIYFMFDSSQVQQDFIPVIAAHAQYLVSHPTRRLTLEGHADERGSSEYNIALGEQRAKSVARMMKVQGVSESQLQIVSYGEEKPAVDGHDESAYQLNRRVELLYQGQ